MAVIILLAILVIYITTKPSLIVKSIEVTDIVTSKIEGPFWVSHCPGIKIFFKTDKYPVKFYLLTSEGKVIDSYKAELPEEVAYLAINEICENIVGPKKYVVKAFIDDEEVLRREINVKGVSGSIRILNTSISVITHMLGNIKEKEPKIDKILIEVENTGDVPLYLACPLFNPVVLSVDGNPLFFTPSKEVIMPGSRERVELSIFGGVDPDERHVFTISVSGIENAPYITEPLRPEVRIDEVKLGYENFSRSWFMENITITIRNTEAYPIGLHHLEMYANDKFFLPFVRGFVNPGEEKTVTIGGTFYVKEKPSEIKIKLYGTEVVYRISEG